MKLKLKNTLTRKKEDFVPIKEGQVGIYSCGPTVYWNQHIGHMYAYVHWDILVRTLRFFGYKVKWVMNITDVGHMTGENEGNADLGEDKMEKGAKREGISVWDLADKYIAQFEESLNLLGVTTPDVMPRATKHIPEQISLAEKIEANGFTYTTKKGLVYDTQKFPEYAKFANLDLNKQQKRTDVEDDSEKKLPWDFFLWAINNKHLMTWESPWGVGYPGWHLECTAMSTKYLGNKFDIHTGGIEHISVHHTNEIAQGYGAFGDKTANYWIHNAHLMAKGGEKMSKSLGNFVTVSDIVKKGYDPLALRYLYLNSHYSKGLNFSFEALAAAQVALLKIRDVILSIKKQEKTRETLSQEKLEKIENYRNTFSETLGDDLNVAKAIGIVWDVIKSNIPPSDKYDLLVSFDEVLGLGLTKLSNDEVKTPDDVQKMIDEREILRKQKRFLEADKIRLQIEEKGFVVEDSGDTIKVKYKPPKIHGI